MRRRWRHRRLTSRTGEYRCRMLRVVGSNIIAGQVRKFVFGWRSLGGYGRCKLGLGLNKHPLFVRA